MNSGKAVTAEVNMSDRASLRRMAGLTQIQLGRKVGISGPRICLWERGEIELQPEQVEQVAKVLQGRLERAPRFSCVRDLAQTLAPANPLPPG
jgi:transcriptional regulator with XRE-family HTH domain